MEHKLIAYYEQTLDTLEQSEVEQWIEADPANKKIYEDTILVWKHSKLSPKYQLLNKEKAWENLQTQINATPADATPKRRIVKLNWWKWTTVAASVAAIVILFQFLNKAKKPEQFVAHEVQQKISLKDNSLITLYAHSALTVASDFNKKSRTVVLKGNAHFDITRNPDKPFIIHNQEMDIEVLGTSFTIQQDLNTVFVHSGKVKATLKNKSVVATAHQKIIIDQKTNSLRVDHFSDMIVGILKTQTIKVKDIRDLDEGSKQLNFAQMLDRTATEDLYQLAIKLTDKFESDQIDRSQGNLFDLIEEFVSKETKQSQ